VLLGVNSFDQFGVELGKQLAGSLSEALTGRASADGRDPSTRAWVKRLSSS
jgi:glucose-6-phosphate isomerase